MPLKVLGRALQNTVAKRMAAVFFMCTVMPLAGFAWLTVRQTTETLEERGRRALQAEARSVGQEALGRLNLLARSLSVLGTALGEASSSDIAREQATSVVLTRPRNSVLAPVNGFVRSFLLMAVFLALIVTWVSLAQVRKHLRPLDQLVAATKRLARRDFSERLRVTSRDEFEAVADAFNELATTLERQFAELETFSLGSLAALARAIDAKSPWTSGHSERVTAIAVALGQELTLPETELQHLQHGGLVHDLGKLATPAEILDKPGPLTADEHAIMAQHPLQGVRILEPIPAFAPLLPIVAEHHEWWNGEGYPRRLAGLAISRAARVLAVADVYDALRSERPYRVGLPHARVVDLIVSGAGQQFDPEVVDAFLTIAKHVNAIAGYPGDAAREATANDPVGPELVQVGRD